MSQEPRGRRGQRPVPPPPPQSERYANPAGPDELTTEHVQATFGGLAAPSSPEDGASGDSSLVLLASARRQSPLGPLFNGWMLIRRAGFIHLGVFASVLFGSGLGILLLVALCGLAAVSVLTWWRFRYWVQGNDLIVESGLISLTTKNVPLDKIQSVSTRQNLLHQIFDVVEVSVETAGSKGSEVELKAVSRSEAEHLQRVARSTPRGATNLDEGNEHFADPGNDNKTLQTQFATPKASGLNRSSASQLILKRDLGEIVEIALTRQPILAFALLAFPLSFAEQISQFGWIGDAVKTVGARVEGSTLAFVGAVIAMALVLIGIIVASTVLRLFDLTVQKSHEGLTMSAGLTTRTNVTVPFDRVQLMALRQNPIERWRERFLVRLPDAGGTRGAGQTFSLPGTRRAELVHLKRLVLSENWREITASQAHQVSKKMILRRSMWLGVAPAVVCVVAFRLTGSWWGLLGAGAIPIAFLVAWWSHRNLSWSLDPEGLILSRGCLTRQYHAVPVRKVQTVRVAQSFFYRRHSLAAVEFATAADKVVVPYLSLNVARQLRDELIFRSQTDPRPFM